MIDVLNKIVEYIEKLDSRLDKIDKTLIAQHESLKHHIYRTDLAEDRIDKFEKETKQELRDIHKELNPIKAHVNRIDGAFKLIGIIATVVGIAATIYNLFI